MELCDSCKQKNCKKIIIIKEKDGLKTIKCLGYEKDESKIQGYKEPIKKTAKLQPLVMKNFISDWSCF